MAWNILVKRKTGGRFVWRPKWNPSGLFRRKGAERYEQQLDAQAKDADYARVRESAASKPSTGAFNVIPRSQWAVRFPELRPTSWSRQTPTRVHHSTGPAPAPSLSREKQWMRDTERFHVESRDYVAIGYNYVIMPSGRVFEGRGFEKVGAHTEGHNNDVGVCFAGDYSTSKPSAAAVAAYHKLRRSLGLAGVQRPHRATFSTTCPGNGVMRALGL
jgi:hypothetical protein